MDDFKTEGKKVGTLTDKNVEKCAERCPAWR